MSKSYPVRELDVEKLRERAIEVVMEHFSNDVMDLARFEEILDTINGCTTAVELRNLLQQLPPLAGSEEPTTDMIPAQGGGPIVVDANRVREYGFLVSVLGSTARSGRWIPARRTFALGVLGGISLDFRESVLGPGPTDVNVLAVLGRAEIIVPPGMAVEVDGMAVLGGFEHQTDTPLRNDPDIPTLRVRGLAILGGVEVRVQLPGETHREAKRRRRLERKEGRRRRLSG
jgi:hypothetical protein